MMQSGRNSRPSSPWQKSTGRTDLSDPWIAVWKTWQCVSCYDTSRVAVHLSLSTITRHTDKIERIQERWIIRRVFENAQDASSVANAFRDIVILMEAFQVSIFGGCVKK